MTIQFDAQRDRDGKDFLKLITERSNITLGDWVGNANPELKQAVICEGYHFGIRGPTVKLAGRSEVQNMQFGSTMVRRDYVPAGSAELTLVPDGYLDELRQQCEELSEGKAPSWTTDDVFTYLLLGFLPLRPFEFDFHYAYGQPYGYFYSFSYPVSEDFVINLHKVNMERARYTEFMYFSAQPKPLTEYDLSLIDLVYSMPLQDFSWAERLESYLQKFDLEVKAGLMTDLGLGNVRTNIGGDKWHNAARNLGRDYKKVLRKLGWHLGTDS